MKFAIFALLLVIAGAHAVPKPAEVDVAQGRFVDAIVRNAIQTFIRWIRNAGWDPKDIVERNFHYTFPGLLNLKGSIKGLRFTGLSDIRIDSLTYNILFGRLSFNLVMPQLKLTVGDANISGNILTRDIEGELSGSLTVKGIRLRGDALLILDINWVQIYNINVDFSVADVDSALKVSGSEDYSDVVNDVLGVRIPEFLISRRNEINVILGQLIREIVRIWNDRPRSFDLE